MTTPSISPFQHSAEAPTSLVFLLNLRLGTLGNSKKVPSTAVKVVREFDFDPDTDPEMLRVNKTLLDCPELREIKRYHHELRDYIEARELPTKGQFRAGMYLMSYRHLDAIEARLTMARENIGELVDQLVEALPERIEQSRARLGTLFNEHEYPSEATIREKLRIQFEYQTLATPEGLKRINREMFDREQAKLQRRMQEALDDSRAIIAQQTRDLLSAVADRLTPDESGKPKIIQANMAANWTAALEMLGDKNITGDSDLTAVIEQAKARIAGRGASDLKSDAATREEITAAFAELIARLDDQVIDKPLRQISFDEAA